RDIQEKLLANLGRFWANESNQEQKLEALRVCEVCLARMGRPADETARQIVRPLDELFPNKQWPLHRELVQLLIALEAPGIVKKTLDLRDAAATQEEQLHYMVALRNARNGWSPDERRRYFAWFRVPSATVDPGPGHTGSDNDFIKRSNRHSAETIQWFKDV